MLLELEKIFSLVLLFSTLGLSFIQPNRSISYIKDNKLKFSRYSYIEDIITIAMYFILCLAIIVTTLLLKYSTDDDYFFFVLGIFILFFAILLLVIKNNSGEFEKVFPDPPEPRKVIAKDYTWKLEVTGFYGFTSAELESKVNEYLRENNSAIVKGDATKNFEIYLTIQDSATFDGEEFKKFLHQLNSTCGVNMHHLNDYQKLFTTHVVVSIVLMIAFLVILIAK